MWLIMSDICNPPLPPPPPPLPQPYHVVVEVDSREEVTSEIIETKLQETRYDHNDVNREIQAVDSL